jgi:hypothetical protein
MCTAGCAAFLTRQWEASDICGNGFYQLLRRRRGEPETTDARIIADR